MRLIMAYCIMPQQARAGRRRGECFSTRTFRLYPTREEANAARPDGAPESAYEIVEVYV